MRIRVSPSIKKALSNAYRSDGGRLHGAVVFCFSMGMYVEEIAQKFKVDRADVEEIIRKYWR